MLFNLNKEILFFIFRMLIMAGKYCKCILLMQVISLSIAFVLFAQTPLEGERESDKTLADSPESITSDVSADVLTNDLSFFAIEQAANLRDPFWSVGYDPSKLKKGETSIIIEPPKEVPPKWSEAMKQLQIRGVMEAKGVYVANINGQIYGAGETVSIDFQGKRYSWEVHTVDEQGVYFRQIEVAPIKSPPAIKAAVTKGEYK